MPKSKKKKPVEQTPAVSYQPATYGTQVIQRPTANTSTDRAMKEG